MRSNLKVGSDGQLHGARWRPKTTVTWTSPTGTPTRVRLRLSRADEALLRAALGQHGATKVCVRRRAR